MKRPPRYKYILKCIFCQGLKSSVPQTVGSVGNGDFLRNAAQEKLGNEDSGDGGRHEGGQAAADERFDSKAGQALPQALPLCVVFAQSPDAADLDADGKEIRKSAKRVGGNDVGPVGQLPGMGGGVLGHVQVGDELV